MGKSVLARHPDKGDYHTAVVVDQVTQIVIISVAIPFFNMAEFPTKCKILSDVI